MQRPITRIIKKEIPVGRRILVTSDIHGHLSFFENALKKADFCENDILVIVGDIVEKGPNSLGALRCVMNLCERGNVIALIGNVDAYRMELIDTLTEADAEEYFEYLLRLRKWYGSSFYDELANECGFEIGSPADILNSKETVIAHFEKEFSFLASLPTVVETQNFIFVHGGLYDKEPSANAGRSVYELTKYDSFLTRTELVFDKYVVVGHWPVCLYNDRIQQLNPVFDKEKHIIALDGGCGTKNEAQINLLVIPDINSSVEEISHISCDEIPKVIALEAQSASEDPLHISWLSQKIELLERGEEFSYIRHEQSGRCLFVPNAYLRNETSCNDYTDYELFVEAGDEMAMVFECSRGIIAKRNGVIGWYRGKFKQKKETTT
ncbi:MAG: metallophosphoesterase [Clostridia bacterium]|nr:metallophosphoesterase [Clostridia bacterium]